MIAPEPDMLPGRDERVEIVGQVEHVDLLLGFLAVQAPALELELLARLEDFGRGAAGDDRLELAPVAQAAAEGRVVDQLAEGDLADLDLVVARPLHLAAEADDAGAGVVGRAELGVFRAAHGDDVLDRAERLDVVDDGRAQVEPEHRREIGRLDARIGALAFQRLDQAGFLAADVGAGAAVDVDLEVVAASPGCSCPGSSSPGLPCSARFRIRAPSANSPRM